MKRTNQRQRFSFGTAFVVLLCSAGSAFAQTVPSLGDAQNFGVLAGSTVTNTGATVIGGHVGVSPGSAITGFPPGTVSSGSSTHAGNATAAAAQTSLTTAYNDLAGQTPTRNLTGQDLGGLTLTTGVYKFDSSAQLTGTLTLDAQGSTNSSFIFQIGSSLTTASNSSITMINGGSLCNVFWQVGSSATLGTTTHFLGNILALTSITLNTGATVTGRTLARNGAVTLDTNTTTAAQCSTTGGGQPAGCPVVGLTPTTIPNANVGVAYSQQFTGNSGTAPYVYSTDSASLPAGLTLTAAGLLSGTPTSAVPQSFTIRATDTLGCFAERSYTMLFGVAVPTMPQFMFVLLALGLMAIGYRRLRSTRAG
ncbi:MAG: ice-binding family protein [Vicinamibacterales bacterium]